MFKSIFTIGLEFAYRIEDPDFQQQQNCKAGGDRVWKKVNGNPTQIWIGDIYEIKNGKVLCHVFAGDKMVATFEPASTIACIINGNPYLKKSYEMAETAYAGLFGGGRTSLTLLGFGMIAGLYIGIRLRKSPRGGYMFFYKNPYRQFLGITIIAALFIATTPEICYADPPTYDPVFYYYHSDHLGSSQVMTDRDGYLVQHYPDISGFGVRQRGAQKQYRGL
ncbi:MAG: hypothetical protein JW804_09100 [Sedimentisphaerales bacterium]|nr:hypothetical protein [Sedimentisphaerales bacterium]